MNDAPNPEIPESIGRYQIISEIGRGGMGVVYKAVDPNIDRTVALKVIRLAFQADDSMKADMKERFRREAKATGVLDHPNIVTVYDADEHEGTPYIAMEFVEGDALEDLIGPDELLPVAKVNSIVAQVALGLHAAHDKDVIHRDVKPANVLVTDDGVAKLMDFGIARFSDSELTRAGTVIGSPSYMSPEQLTGQPVDRRSDVFSLGVLLYQLLTGEKPFPGDNATAISYRIIRTDHLNPSEVNPLAPSDYDQILKNALAKRPEDRYDNAQQMADDLARVMGGQEVGGSSGDTLILKTPHRMTEAAGSIFRTSWFRWVAITAAIMIVLAVLVVVSMKLSNPFVEVQSMIDLERHDQAIVVLLEIHAKKPKDHRALYMLGREYAEVEDYRSSMLAYGKALALKKDYRDDQALHDDVLAAFTTPDADAAIELILGKIGDPIKEKLQEALTNPEYGLHWNAAKALQGMDEEVDDFPLLVLDLRYNLDCKIRRKAIEILGVMGEKNEVEKERVLPELEWAEQQSWNNWSCMKNSLKEALEKFDEPIPEIE